MDLENKRNTHLCWKKMTSPGWAIPWACLSRKRLESAWVLEVMERKEHKKLRKTILIIVIAQRPVHSTVEIAEAAL